MPLHVFTVSVFHSQPMQDELLHSLATLCVVWLEKQWLPATRRVHSCAVVWSEPR